VSKKHGGKKTTADSISKVIAIAGRLTVKLGKVSDILGFSCWLYLPRKFLFLKKRHPSKVVIYAKVGVIEFNFCVDGSLCAK
jgi:hypothetical protein